ncbi:hypothetical protein GGU10DRAFT_380870 [Lentinula aff. detonsa]|uniref:Uncharacterized protein n=1 Tax=Lentinula aff. detonsa TaxID=2804958 RepID=A0AA38L1Q1_9AGAR|nr:hypothetical protein GGU10DRAFT_380870 [Lentinula aff. detonsa]
MSDSEGSSVASLYSISSEEWVNVRKSPTLFQRLKEWIPARYLGWMTQMNEAEAQGRTPSQSVGANPAVTTQALTNSKLMDTIVEYVEDPTTVTEVDIPHQLHEMAKYHQYLPLPIFTDNNLLYIRNHLSKIKTEKIRLPNATEKTSILLLSDILEQLNIKEGIANEGLTYSKFKQAAANYYRFETERDPVLRPCQVLLHHPPPRPSRLKDRENKVPTANSSLARRSTGRSWVFVVSVAGSIGLKIASGRRLVRLEAELQRHRRA